MSDVTLIKITGPDQPGITLSVTTLLAEYAIHVLDIGQAVIHNNLALGLLVEIPQQVDQNILFSRVSEKLETLGMSIELSAVDADAYDAWTKEQGKPRHIVTLLVRKVKAEHISAVTELVTQYGLNIEKLRAFLVVYR